MNALFWHGIVVPYSEWDANRPKKPYKKSSDVKGRGYRVAVRIFGKHPRSKNDVADSELALIEVMGSVSGSGIGGNGETPGISQGDEVFGIYQGENQTDPIIIGTRLPNANLKLFYNVASNDSDGFKRLSGFKSNQPISKFLISPYEKYTLENTKVVSPNQISVSDFKKIRELSFDLLSPCDSTNLSSIQRSIKNLIQQIEKAKQFNNSAVNSILYPIQYNGQNVSIEKYIENKVNDVAKEISRVFKNVVNQIREYLINKINTLALQFYKKLFPKERFAAIQKVQTAIDLIFCLFNKITSKLIQLIGGILKQVVDKYINVPICAVENIVSNILASIVNLINQSIQSILKPIQNILGSVSILINDFFTIAQNILLLFSCDEKSSCPTVNSWNPIQGANSQPTIDISKIISRSKQILSDTQNLTIDFDNLNSVSLLDSDCDIGPLFCGPPQIEFIGGGGSGASANAVINLIGQIIGVDIVTSGSNYTSAPIVKFNDSCGLGSGAIGQAEVNSNGQISRVLILDSGQNYLSNYDGSLGGDSRVWAEADQVVVQRNDGTYDPPYNSNNTPVLNAGDVQTGPYKFTSESLNTTFPYTSKGQYPVYLKLCETRILNAGFNYQPNDEIIIEPNYGAKLTPQFNEYGSLVSVNIDSSGMGFDQIPNIYILSETGRNAQILPVLCVHSVVDNFEPSKFDAIQVFSVVDCVGKIQ